MSNVREKRKSGAGAKRKPFLDKAVTIWIVPKREVLTAFGLDLSPTEMAQYQENERQGVDNELIGNKILQAKQRLQEFLMQKTLEHLRESKITEVVFEDD